MSIRQDRNRRRLRRRLSPAAAESQSQRFTHARYPRRGVVLDTSGLFQSLEFALALHDVLVVPLDFDRLLEPSLEILGHDLIVRRVPDFGGLETTFGLKTRLVEGLAAPEKEADAVVELAVADNRISVQEPHWVPV